MLYLALVPLAALMLETLFVQPQALSLGVPLAVLGVVVMALQITDVIGYWSHRLEARFGVRRMLNVVPALIVLCLVLASFQKQLALIFIAIISSLTSSLHPMVMSRIQRESTDEIRATLLWLPSLMGTVLATISQPVLGLVADRSGLPVAYLVLAGGLVVLSLPLVGELARV
jgi:energy-converting hydrogenase Eha subunit E